MAKYESKYFYMGKTLKQYCIENSLSYSSARNKICKLKSLPEYSDLTDEEIVQLTIKAIEKGNTIYFYNGASLSKYCKANGIDNTCVRKKVRQLKELEEYRDWSLEEIITLAIKSVVEGNIKYFVGEVSLYVYCIENDINYGTIINGINRYKNNCLENKLSDEEVVLLILKNYLPNNNTYYVDNEPLTDYCRRLGINAGTVIRKLKGIIGYDKEERGRIDISLEVINSIIANIKDVNGTIYFYKNIPLRKYCIDNGLSYNSIVVNINKCKKSNVALSIEELVNNAIKKKRFKEHLNDKKQLRINYNDFEFVDYYCNKYNICLKKVKELIALNYSCYIAINIIDYLGDTTVNGKKSISESKLKELLSIIVKDNKSLDELLLIQGLGVSGWELHIVKSVEGLIVNILKSYNVSRYYFKDYKSALEDLAINVLDNDFTLRPAQFIVYLKKVLNGRLVSFFYQNQIVSMSGANDNMLSVEAESQNVEEEYFRKERIDIIRQELSKLDANEIKFISRRFGFNGEPLTLDELMNRYYPEMSLMELHEIETNILDKLRNSDNIQTLKSL